MMHAAGGHALALPHLSPAIPLKYMVTGQDALVAPLTIALLEADVISTAMLRHRSTATLASGIDARELSMRALSSWWTALVKANSCKFFRWQLHVQDLSSHDIQPEHEDAAWFIFTRMTEFDLPRFALERQILRLEGKLEGFGQTVLAVLQDATMRLPESFTPWRAVDFAEYFHWNCSENDADLLEEYREMNGYTTVQEVLDNDGVLTRAEFYKDMPEWVTAPRRVVSREAICAMHLSVFELRVVAACDAVADLVGCESFNLHPADKGVSRTNMESTEGAMALLWREGDVIGRVTDDFINDLYESGNSHDFIDANPVPMTAAGIRDFQSLTEQMMQLAVLTERLILLIGEKL